MFITYVFVFTITPKLAKIWIIFWINNSHYKGLILKIFSVILAFWFTLLQNFYMGRAWPKNQRIKFWKRSQMFKGSIFNVFLMNLAFSLTSLQK